jgi:hypothetical protein
MKLSRHNVRVTHPDAMHEERNGWTIKQAVFSGSIFYFPRFGFNVYILSENINVADNPSVCVFAHHNGTSCPKGIYGS